MNAKYFYIALAIWIIAVVPLGFSESFQNRPTGSDMDDAVALGTECVLGVNERCLAVQLDPPFVKTNAAIGWYLDQNMMGQMASAIKSLVPYFVDSATVYDGTTNIAMLTVTGVWARLEIGDHTNKFTCTPAIGTNAATYGDCPWRIYTNDLVERYKAIWAQQQSVAVVSCPWIEKWSGMGCGLTLADAYTAASTNYKFQTNGYLPWLTFEQTCISTFWSNYNSSVGAPYPYGTVVSSGYVSSVVSSVVTGQVDVVSATNLSVSGAITPDVTGTDYAQISDYNGYSRWQGTYYVVRVGGEYYLSPNATSNGYPNSWVNIMDPTNPVGSYADYPSVTGTAEVAYFYIYTNISVVTTNSTTNWGWVDIPYIPTWVSGSGTNTVTNSVSRGIRRHQGRRHQGQPLIIDI